MTSRDYVVRGSCEIVGEFPISEIISQYPDKFCGDRPYRIGDILFLIGHVTSCHTVVNGLYGIMGGCLSS